jgi:hypothetical protein
MSRGRDMNTTVEEVFRAFELGIITKQEARTALGLVNPIPEVQRVFKKIREEATIPSEPVGDSHDEGKHPCKLPTRRKYYTVLAYDQLDQLMKLCSTGKKTTDVADELNLCSHTMVRRFRYGYYEQLGKYHAKLLRKWVNANPYAKTEEKNPFRVRDRA